MTRLGCALRGHKPAACRRCRARIAYALSIPHALAEAATLAAEHDGRPTAHRMRVMLDHAATCARHGLDLHAALARAEVLRLADGGR